MTAKTPAKPAVSLDALAQQRRALLPEPTPFELFGVEFTLPPMKSLPLEIQEKVGSMDDTVGILKQVLGVDKVKEMYRAGYTFGDLQLIGEQWQERSGLEPGEAHASSPS